MRDDATGRTITAHEPRDIPWLEIVLGFGPMLPLAAGAAAAWWMRGKPLDYLVVLVTQIYAAAILVFLAGVRRGLSFRTEGGPRVAQIATMLVLFVLGLAALVGAVLGQAVLALSLMLAGYVLILVLDPIAARAGEAPLSFARLRPLQMPIAVLSLAALLWLKLIAPY